MGKSFLEYLGEEHLIDTNVSKNVTKSEYACSHCSGFPPLQEYPEQVSNQWYKAIREFLNVIDNLKDNFRNLKMNSMYRCSNYQNSLHNKNPHAVSFSPHSMGVAADITRGNARLNKDLLIFLQKNYSEMRIGHYEYNLKWIHIDMTYLTPLKELNSLGYVPKRVIVPWSKKGARW